eukprot:55469-Eustigmatos_ZCMA.PRE.1
MKTPFQGWIVESNSVLYNYRKSDLARRLERGMGFRAALGALTFVDFGGRGASRRSLLTSFDPVDDRRGAQHHSV